MGFEQCRNDSGRYSVNFIYILKEGSVRSRALLDQMKSDVCFRFLQDFEYFSNLYEGSQT